MDELDRHLNPKEMKKQKGDDSDLARRNRDRFNEAYDNGHSDYVKDARRFDKMYLGDQWDEEDKQKLTNEGRPALTLNMILSTINTMIGEQLERKVQVLFQAERQRDENTALVINALARSVYSANEFDDLEKLVFSDGLIQDRGYFDIRMAFDRNVDGEIVISDEDPVDVIPDPEAKSYDPNDWNECFLTRWQTPDQIRDRFGDEIADRVLAIGVEDEGSKDHVQWDRVHFGEDDEVNQTRTEDEDRSIRRVRVVERQYYKWEQSQCTLNDATGEVRLAPRALEGQDLELYALERGLRIIDKKMRVLKCCTTVSDILLEHKTLPYRSFTIVPFFPYYRRGQPFGVVRNLIDPQMLLNKTSSQELHIVNTTANSGWIVEENSLTNMKEDDLETEGAKTGLLLKYRRSAQKPEKIQPNQIPTGIDRISQKASVAIREISAVNREMLGMARPDQSGKAMDAQVQRGQVQVSVVLDNLKKTRRIVARKVLELMQDYYTETRRFWNDTENEPMAEASSEMFINGIDAVTGEMINDITQGNYKVNVSYAPDSDSERENQAGEIERLRSMGVMIPDHVVVEYSNLHQRRALSEFLQRINGFAEPTPEEQEMMEIQRMAEIETIRKSLDKMDADIEAVRAKAARDMSEVSKAEGYNDVQMELAKLETDRELRQQELSLRLALATRSQANQKVANNQRTSTTIATTMMNNQSAERIARMKTTQQAKQDKQNANKPNPNIGDKK